MHCMMIELVCIREKVCMLRAFVCSTYTALLHVTRENDFIGLSQNILQKVFSCVQYIIHTLAQTSYSWSSQDLCW